MINPNAIIHLDDATIETSGGSEENVSRLAAWDWTEINDSATGETLLKVEMNGGNVYARKKDVTNISELG